MKLRAGAILGLTHLGNLGKASQRKSLEIIGCRPTFVSTGTGQKSCQNTRIGGLYSICPEIAAELSLRRAKTQSSSERKDCEFDTSFGGAMVKLLVRDKESIQEAVRRFRKLVERSGIKKEMRRREYYEKPSETKRRARLRAERRSKRARMLNKR